MRFLVDMPLPPRLANWLIDQGHEASHVSEVGLAQSSDEAIPDGTRSNAAVVITADLDFPRLLALSNVAGPGVILLRGGDFNDEPAISFVDRVLASIPQEDLPGLLVVVDRMRVRKRPLSSA